MMWRKNTLAATVLCASTMGFAVAAEKEQSPDFAVVQDVMNELGEPYQIVSMAKAGRIAVTARNGVNIALSLACEKDACAGVKAVARYKDAAPKPDQLAAFNKSTAAINALSANEGNDLLFVRFLGEAPAFDLEILQAALDELSAAPQRYAEMATVFDEAPEAETGDQAYRAYKPGEVSPTDEEAADLNARAMAKILGDAAPAPAPIESVSFSEPTATPVINRTGIPDEFANSFSR
ncbi:MAG: hypothetical protein AAGB02_07070 [Pseudomonadota bacterium]